MRVTGQLQGETPRQCAEVGEIRFVRQQDRPGTGGKLVEERQHCQLPAPSALIRELGQLRQKRDPSLRKVNVMFRVKVAGSLSITRSRSPRLK